MSSSKNCWQSWKTKILRRISVSDLNRSRFDSSVQLKRELRLFDIVIFGICQTIGSGIFVIPGVAAKEYTGSGLFIAFIIGAITGGASSLCYAEFGSRIPYIGGSYMYTYLSNGELIGFITGLLTAFRSIFSIATNGLGWVGYLKSFLISININVGDDNIFFGKDSDDDSQSLTILAPVIMTILAFIGCIGIKTSKNFMNILAVWNVSLLLLFIVAGILLFDEDIFLNPCDNPQFGDTCPDDANPDSLLAYGFNGLISASGMAFFAFMGLDTVGTIAEESYRPKRDIPRGIYITLFIITCLYLSISVVIVGMVCLYLLQHKLFNGYLCLIRYLFNLWMKKHHYPKHLEHMMKYFYNEYPVLVLYVY